MAHRHAHVLGIGERGVTALAQWLVERGYPVTSSASGPDAPAQRLRSVGIRVHPGHLHPSARWMVYARGIDRLHPGRLAAARGGLPQASSADVLNHLIGQGWSVALWGGRTSSVAAAMVGWILVRAGLDPTVLLGSSAPQLGGWGRLGRGGWCVVEADPISERFAPDAVRIAVILDLDQRSGAAQAAALRSFFASLPQHALVLGSGHDGTIARALRGIAAQAELVSLCKGCAWWGTDLREERGRYRFRAFYRGRFVVEARLQVPGRRSVFSALAAVAVCQRMDVPARAIKEGLEEFAGIARGLESRGSWRGVTLVDDEASDPRLVAEAVQVCRQAFGRRRLGIVVQPPPLASWVPYAPSLAAADWVLVAGAEPEAAGPGPGRWVEPLAAAGVAARWAAGLECALADLERHLEPGDVLLTLGSGQLGTIADALSTRRAGRDPLPW
ncbi:MAG TPA: Mur ligase domain-containing protein [Isosphaeraceae bacterium]|nr:Mur ligase domain-containing protein [Isosphaeraceae bacterium]